MGRAPGVGSTKITDEKSEDSIVTDAFALDDT